MTEPTTPAAPEDFVSYKLPCGHTLKEHTMMQEARDSAGLEGARTDKTICELIDLAKEREDFAPTNDTPVTEKTPEQKEALAELFGCGKTAPGERRVVLVRYTIEIPVDMTGWPEDYIQFDIEENSCLGTHNAGVAFDKIYDAYTNGEMQGFCWACALCFRNGKIIDWNYRPEQPSEKRIYDIVVSPLSSEPPQSHQSRPTGL